MRQINKSGQYVKSQGFVRHICGTIGVQIMGEATTPMKRSHF